MSSTVDDVPEAAVDPSTKDIIAWMGKIGYWIVYPVGIAIYYLFYYLSLVLLALLKLIYKPLLFILAPLIYLAQFVLTCLQAPFHFLAKFETLYIYLSVGAMIGIVGGLSLYFIYSLLQKPLGLEATPEQAGRTVKQYREEKQKEKTTPEPFPLASSPESMAPGYANLSDRSRKMGRGHRPLTHTILEEVDSDS